MIVFDNTGVGQSSGSTPDNVAQMAVDARHFISALGFSGIDLLGYSLGGFVAQQLAAAHPDLVRRIVLVGTAARGGEEHLLAVLDEARSHKEAPDIRLPLSRAVRQSRVALLDGRQIRGTAESDLLSARLA